MWIVRTSWVVSSEKCIDCVCSPMSLMACRLFNLSKNKPNQMSLIFREDVTDVAMTVLEYTGEYKRPT